MTAVTQIAPQPRAPSAWAPMHLRVFRILWIAALASNLGGWMHLVAAGWLMTSLTGSAALVAFLQTASSAPSFLLALPAGALADVLDRRRLILATQASQFAVAAALGVLTLAHLTSPAVLLALTFALATGAALGLPAFSAITAELVPRDQLPAAISLNSIVVTASQAVGPALGGVLVASLGSGAVFIVNALSFLAVVVAVFAWHRPAPATTLPPEHVSSAIRAGARYVANAPAFRIVLIRAGAYVLGFSVMPALLAVVTRGQLHGSASDFGLLLGAVGVGGVASAVALPRVRTRLSADAIVVGGTLAYAAMLAAMANVRSVPAATALLLAGGFVGMANMSSLNISAQSILADWVRGRGLALFQFTFMAAFAGGAALWGSVATHIGVQATLEIAAAWLAASCLLTLRYRLDATKGVDATIAEQHEPFVPVTLAADDGPVMLSVEYRFAGAQADELRAAVARLARVRRREGAMHWGLYADPNDPPRHVETFVVASWSEHLRTAGRRTRTDAELIDAVRAYHTGEAEPRLTALVSAR